MSYLVLSLKYRPQTFDEVVGQMHITQTLTNAFKKDRVSQAYLFTGPRGVGKTTTARLVAKALNCMESPGNPCNKCSNCIEITDGRNMDVLEIDGASNRGIEEIRGLRESIQYAPINSKFKIFIIDEVHMLTTPAFNALLRTLEEPPVHGKFILATTDIYKVPATIISRCQRFDFNSITVNSISEQIKYVLGKEKISIDDDSLKIIAQKADGSMRDALSILDQIIAYSGDNISIESVNKVLGIIPIDIYFNILDTILTKKGKVLIDILTNIKSKGMPVQEFVSGLNRHIRNMMIATIENSLDVLELNSDLKKQYEETAKSWNIRDLLRISKVITDIEPQIKRAIQPHILIELSLLKLLELDSTVTIESLLDRFQDPLVSPSHANPKKLTNDSTIANKALVNNDSIEIDNPKLENVKKDINSVSEPIPRSTTTNNISLDKIIEKWDELIEELSSERPSIGNVLSHCKVNQFVGNRLEIKLIDGNNFNLKTLEKNKVIIEKYFEKVYNKPLKAVFLMTKSKLPKKETDVEKNTIETNKTTEKLIELFDGEILN
ncbi:MAG: DNA polymerase III subunit gamma/tau [Planctomycetia bacterium]|nr:DNA polymerase III subunit gamma/tau [Planctomycetia bacterium]